MYVPPTDTSTEKVKKLVIDADVQIGDDSNRFTVDHNNGNVHMNGSVNATGGFHGTVATFGTMRAGALTANDLGDAVVNGFVLPGSASAVSLPPGFLVSISNDGNSFTPIPPGQSSSAFWISPTSGQPTNSGTSPSDPVDSVDTALLLVQALVTVPTQVTLYIMDEVYDLPAGRTVWEIPVDILLLPYEPPKLELGGYQVLATPTLAPGSDNLYRVTCSGSQPPPSAGVRGIFSKTANIDDAHPYFTDTNAPGPNYVFEVPISGELDIASGDTLRLVKLTTVLRVGGELVITGPARLTVQGVLFENNGVRPASIVSQDGKGLLAVACGFHGDGIISHGNADADHLRLHTMQSGEIKMQRCYWDLANAGVYLAPAAVAETGAKLHITDTVTRGVVYQTVSSSKLHLERCALGEGIIQIDPSGQLIGYDVHVTRQGSGNSLITSTGPGSTAQISRGILEASGLPNPFITAGISSRFTLDSVRLEGSAGIFATAQANAQIDLENPSGPITAPTILAVEQTSRGTLRGLSGLSTPPIYVSIDTQTSFTIPTATATPQILFDNSTTEPRSYIILVE